MITVNIPFLAAAIVTAFLLWALHRSGFSFIHLAKNFEGVPVPVAGALLAGGIVAGLRSAEIAGVVGMMPSTLTVAAFGALGWLDDRYGDRSVSGLRGHLGAALRGRFTTGFWKLAGGGLAALVAMAYRLPSPPWWRVLVGALVIALAANAFNLLDTRPVRSTLAFLLLAVPAWLSTKSVPLAAGLGAALVWLPCDRGRRVMLGDAGSNALGALLAVSTVDMMPDWLLLATLALLVAFHTWTERYSMNAFIAGRPALARMDAWLSGNAPS